jgi:hypothetical protein
MMRDVPDPRCIRLQKKGDKKAKGKDLATIALRFVRSNTPDGNDFFGPGRLI